MNKLNGTNPLARYTIVSGGTVRVGDLVVSGETAGQVTAASASATTPVIGVASKVLDGEVEVTVGVIALSGSTTNAVTRADRGKPVCVEDARTVAISGSTVGAGLVVDVYDGEVYVDVTPAAVAAANA